MMHANTDMETWPVWIVEAMESLRPPPRLSVEEWADSRRILDEKSSSMPGKWRTDVVPYLRDIMNAFNDPDVEEIAFVKPTQVGGTECLLNIMGYIIEVDPSPTMVVYPTEALGESISENRIQPMVQLAPTLKERFDEQSKRLELQFQGMYLVVSGANSPASLGSRPMRNLLLDEIDKYPTNAGKEADPRALARERTKTFDNNRKIFNISTPTFENGPIWQEYLYADSQYQYFVSCPHCGAYWTFKFPQLKWAGSTPEEARTSAVYVCKECDGIITDRQKPDMVRQGEWRATKEQGRRRIAYHLNSFYSPWVRLGDIAYEFLRSKHDPALLMNFINAWLGEPFKQVVGHMSPEWLLDNREQQYERAVVPDEVWLLTGGVDVQRKSFYYTIAAWLPNMTSYNICHGQVFSWKEIENVMNATYFDRQGKGYIVNLALIDSGDQTDDVYMFCRRNAEWAVASKGSSERMQSHYRLSTIDKDGSNAGGQRLCMVDTDYYKDVLFARLKRDYEDGGRFLHAECDAEYVNQLCAEHKVTTKVRNRLVDRWELKASGADNHYLDCEVYAACAADLCGLRAKMAEEARMVDTQPELPPSPRPTPQEQSYLPGFSQGGGWFNR